MSIHKVRGDVLLPDDDVQRLLTTTAQRRRRQHVQIISLPQKKRTRNRSIQSCSTSFGPSFVADVVTTVSCGVTATSCCALVSTTWAICPWRGIWYSRDGRELDHGGSLYYGPTHHRCGRERLRQNHSRQGNCAARQLPYPHFLTLTARVGWGHVVTTGAGNNDYYELFEHTKFTHAVGIPRRFFADQGLLYQWVKYEEKERLDLLPHRHSKLGRVADYRESGAPGPSQLERVGDVLQTKAARVLERSQSSLLFSVYPGCVGGVAARCRLAACPLPILSTLRTGQNPGF
jgi:hypothetical protein